MATAYYSTQASIEARISALRLNGYIDFDGDDSPDEASLTSAYTFARSQIRGRLESKYGADLIDDWDSDTVPDLASTISDDLCIYQIFISNPRFTEIGQTLRTNALDDLDNIADGKINLYNVEAPVVDVYQVERSKSDFDPERDHNKQSVRTTWVLPDTRELPEYPE